MAEAQKSTQPAAQNNQQAGQAAPRAPEDAPTLAPGRLSTAEHRRVTYAVDIPTGRSLEDLLRPGYWAHHAKQLRPWDKIEARCEDGTWYAEFIVLDASRTWARLALVLERRGLGTSDVSQTAASDAEVQALINAHEVKFVPVRKWHVIERASKKVLVEGLQLRDDAEIYLKQHALHLMGRAPAPTPPVRG